MFSVQIDHQSCGTSYPDSSWYNIVNFERPSENQPNLIKIDDQRGLLSKIGYAALAIFRLLVVAFEKNIQRLSSWISGENFPEAQMGDDGKYHYPDAELPWKSTDTESNGLFLNGHGLRGNPKDWQLYSEKIEEKIPGGHHVSPKVVNGGNCELEVSADPYLEICEKYLSQFPGRPITLTGTSNGSRIMQYIETHLDPKV
ncbi:MAG: hypothetical protein H0T62_09240 [Parachlamydiaceae bacterium]|nr:hypothetical protein [Parachlamydiaceae bacterium]